MYVAKDFLCTDVIPKRPFPQSNLLLEHVREFCFERWVERHLELKQQGSLIARPVDLTGSCKFTALFASALFGAHIIGNCKHVFNEVGGEILDVNAKAMDVLGRPNIHRMDRRYTYSREFFDHMRSVAPRVSTWIVRFRAEGGLAGL